MIEKLNERVLPHALDPTTVLYMVIANLAAREYWRKMKFLVTQYQALNINDLARGGWLYPFSKYDWVWRTNKGAHQTTVAITVVTDALELVFAMYGIAGIHQKVSLTYSFGPRGGKRPWFVCPTCPRRVSVLYHATGLPFRCRICCKLAYPSQYQSRDQSYGRQARIVSYREQDRLSAECARET